MATTDFVHVQIDLVRGETRQRLQELVIRRRRPGGETRTHADYDVLASWAAGQRQGVSAGFVDASAPVAGEVWRTRPLMGWRRSLAALQLLQAALARVL